METKMTLLRSSTKSTKSLKEVSLNVLNISFPRFILLVDLVPLCNYVRKGAS